MEPIRKPRGTIDILPGETASWQYVESVIRGVCRNYGFGEIRFPTFEQTELFDRGVGDTTDVVQKEMYTFTDRDGRSLSLRPEGTACVARSVIENGLCAGAMPLKLYYITNFFRYEKPQAGRTREFFQFGTELFGSALPSADAEAIALAHRVFSALGLTSVRLHINSVGCRDCRPRFREALIGYFEKNIDALCPTCRDRLYRNPLRILDCKSPVCSEIAAGAPRTTDYLCDTCRGHAEGVERLLGSAGIEYTVDPHIVRGLDYYTRTVFEFIDDRIGAQSTVCGGGRYDGLVSSIGGPEIPGVGFGMGLTRLLACLERDGLLPGADGSPELYIAPLGEDSAAAAFALGEKLRSAGINVTSDLCGRSVKAQMKYADKISAKRVIVIGGDELAAGRAVMKSMTGGESIEVALTAEDIAANLK